MISLIILIAPLFFIGRFFGELAFEHNRNRWVFRVLAIGVYLALYFLTTFIIVTISALNIEITNDDTYSQIQQKLEGIAWLSLITSITVGSLGVLILFRVLKSSWSKNPKSGASGDLLDR